MFEINRTQSKKQGGVNAALHNEWSVFRDQ